MTTKVDSPNTRNQQSFKSPARTKLKGFVNPNSNHLKQTISSQVKSTATSPIKEKVIEVKEISENPSVIELEIIKPSKSLN